MNVAPGVAPRPIVAALYVQRGGAYWDLPGVDPWDEERDARTYAGPWPVVAHPPCKRWCALAKFVESQHPHLRVGEDDGTFASALAAVRRWGGVLEHPAWSLAWPAFGLPTPPVRGWLRTWCGGWVTEVAQRNYGHRATKKTWLYAVTRSPPPLDWSAPAPPEATISSCSRRGDGTIWRGKKLNGLVELGKREASATPPAFRDVLLEIARSARQQPARCAAEPPP